MPTRREYIRGGLGTNLGFDPARVRRTTSTPQRNQISFGVVGHEDDNPQFVRIEAGQAWVEVTMKPQGDEIVARLGQGVAGAGVGWYLPLSFGCRVVLEFIDGDPNNAVIVARLHDETCAMPGTVAGVSTGAEGITGTATAAAPMWQFLKLPDGELLAIETGANGDYILHCGASVEVKCDDAGRIHLNGAVSLGVGPTTAPTGATVGPAGSTIPGAAAVPAVPTPFTPPTPVPPDGINPYTGQNSEGLVRAKEMYQSHAGIDPNFWVKLTAIATNPLIGVGPIISLTSTVSAAGGNTGSKHTASD